MNTKAAKKEPLSHKLGGDKGETAGNTTRAGGTVSTQKNTTPPKPCQDAPPFAYIAGALAAQPGPARPITDPDAAWRGIVAQLSETRRELTEEYRLSEAACRLERGRLVVHPPIPRSIEWLRKLASAPTRPLAIAAALAGVGVIEFDFE